MKTNRILDSCRRLAALAALLLGGAQAQADVVTKPLRTFGYGTVAAMTVSIDGKFLVTAGNAGAFLWEMETAKVIRQFPTVWNGLWPVGVPSVAISADGKRVMVGNGSWNPGSATAWDAETGQALRTFEVEAPTDVTCVSVAISPDGGQVMAGGSDSIARLWDVATGQMRFSLSGHSNEVRAGAFSLDGQRLLTACNSVAHVWDTATGQMLRSFTSMDAEVLVAGFSPDGTRVLMAGSDLGRVWDAATGRLVSEYRTALGGPIVAARFSSDGTKVYSTCQSYNNNPGPLAELWDAATGQLLRTLPDSPVARREAAPAAFLPDSRDLLTMEGGFLRRWDLESGALVRVFVGHDQGYPAAFSPDGKQVMTGGSRTGGSGGACLWEVSSGNLLRVFDETNGVSSVAFSADGKKVLTAGLFGSVDDNWQVATLGVWDASSAILLLAISQTNEWEWGVGFPFQNPVFSPDSTRILSSDYTTGSVTVRDTVTGQALLRIALANSYAAATFAPDGRWVLVSFLDAQPRAFDAATGEPTRTYGADDEIGCFSPDGKFAATWRSEDGENTTLHLWDVQTGQLVGQSLLLMPSGGRPFLSPGGALLAAVWGGEMGQNQAKIWDVHRGGLPLRQVLLVHGCGGTMLDFLVFSPDGRQLLTCVCAQRAKLWDLGDLIDGDWYGKGWGFPTHASQPLRTFGWGSTLSLALSPDSKLLVTAWAQRAFVWDAGSGQPLHELASSAGVQPIAFSADGTKLVGAPSPIKVWDAQTGELRQTYPPGVAAVAISPDGTQILKVTLSNGVARVWEEVTGQLRQTLITGHAGGVATAVLSRNGRQVLTTGGDFYDAQGGVASG